MTVDTLDDIPFLANRSFLGILPIDICGTGVRNGVWHHISAMSMLISDILKHFKKNMFSPHISLHSGPNIPRHPTTSHVSHLPGSTRTRFWASLPGLTPLGVAATAGDEALVNLGKKHWKRKEEMESTEKEGYKSESNHTFLCFLRSILWHRFTEKSLLEEVSQEIAFLRRSRGTKCCLFPWQSDKSPVFKF